MRKTNRLVVPIVLLALTALGCSSGQDVPASSQSSAQAPVNASAPSSTTTTAPSTDPQPAPQQTAQPTAQPTANSGQATTPTSTEPATPAPVPAQPASTASQHATQKTPSPAPAPQPATQPQTTAKPTAQPSTPAPTPKPAPKPEVVEKSPFETYIDGLPGRFAAENAQGINVVYQFVVTDGHPGEYYVIIQDDKCTSGKGKQANPSVTISVGEQLWLDISTDKVNGTMAYLSGKFSIDGDTDHVSNLKNYFKKQ